MRHGKKVNHLSRKSAHRKAMLANMASSLVEHKRIKTTLAKAKALKTYLEPVVTKAKNDTTHSRRTAFRYLRSKEATKILFDEIAQKIADRPGGYLRVIRLGNRLGDNALMAMIEFVDYNDVYTNDKEKAKSKKKRTRRSGKSKSSDSNATEAKKEAPVKEEAKAETKEAAPETEAPKEEAKTEAKEATPEVEAPKKEKKEEAPAKEEKVEEKKEEAPKAEDKKTEDSEEEKKDDKEK